MPDLPLPPNDPVAEQHVLGACLLAPHVIPDVAEMLPSADRFYQGRHRAIWQAMLEMQAAGKEIDSATLGSWLADHGHIEEAGGWLYVTGLLESVATAVNVRHYAEIVSDKATRRDLIALAWQADALARDTEKPLGDVLTAIEQATYATTQRPESEQAQTGNIEPTGILGLDEILAGFEAGNLVVLGADTGAGKTALALQVAMNFARRDLPVLFISREMTASELLLRAVALEAEVDGDRIRKGILFEPDWPRISMALGRIDQLPLWIDDQRDSREMTIGKVASKARRLASDLGKSLGLIVIDYLQLLLPEAKGGTRAEEVAQMSRGAKGMAGELGCPVLALSQLNRIDKLARDRKPTLDRLRESGAVEQDANIVLLLWKPDGKDRCTHTKGKCPGGSDGPCPTPRLANEAWVRAELAKSRSGPTGYVDLFFARSWTRFETLATKKLEASRA